MRYRFAYSEEKNAVLKEARGVGFRDVIEAIRKGYLLDDVDHFNKKKFPNQRIFIVCIKNKVYAVPYIIDKVRQVTFLKTIYPSRVLKKKYIK